MAAGKPVVQKLAVVVIFAVLAACCGQKRDGWSGASETSAAEAVQSVCHFQEVVEGSSQGVTLSGVYLQGPEQTVLWDPECVARHGLTWVEWELVDDANWKELQRIVRRSHRAYVTVDGDFYGAAPLDPQVPEGQREARRRRWGHLSCCLTRFVIHSIRSVAPVQAVPAVDPDDNPNRPAAHADGS